MKILFISRVTIWSVFQNPVTYYSNVTRCLLSIAVHCGYIVVTYSGHTHTYVYTCSIYCS